MLKVPCESCSGQGRKKHQDRECTCKCPTCGGVRGTITCQRCGGSGKRAVFMRCGTCTGSGQTQCPSCRGLLRNPACLECRGTGEIPAPPCSKCNGAGHLPLTALPILTNMFDFGAWATSERRPGTSVTSPRIEQTIKRLSVEASAKYPGYRHKQSLSWNDNHSRGANACWYDGLVFFYRIYRIGNDGFVMTVQHIDEPNQEDYFAHFAR